MLTSFNLKPDIAVDEFRRSLAHFTAYLEKNELIQTTGPIGRRQRHPIMDTDSERDCEYYFLMSFRDRAQCDRAVEHIIRQEEPGDSIHKSVYSSIAEPVFTCWEDI